MRSSAKALLAGAALIAAMGAASYHLFWPKVARIDPDRPPTPQANVVAPAIDPSFLVVPLRLTTARVVELANDRVPSTVGDKNDLPNFGPTANNRLTWAFARRDITGSAQGGRLILSTTISGSVTVDGKIQPIRGTAGKWLGRLAPSQSYSQPLRVAAEVTATAAPELLPGWRVAGKLEASALLTTASAEIANLFDLSLRDVLQPRVNEAITKALRDLEVRISADQSLERAAHDAWSRACQPAEIKLDAGRPSLWLSINPIGFLATQPTIGTDFVEISLGLRATPSVTSAKPEGRPCSPFPREVEIAREIPSQSEVMVQAYLDYAALNAAIAAELARNNVVGNEEAQARILGMSLSAHGEMILASIDAEFRENRFFGARATGRLFVAIRPGLDAEAQVLRIESARIDGRSSELLASVGLGALRALAPVIETRLAGLSFDMRPQLQELRNRVREVAAKAPSSSDALRITQASLDDVRLVGIGHGPDGLQLTGAARGRIALEVVRLTP
ncbi:DUF4403 family protein [Roseomonas nepalensis]|uniref:DUF4403 family protein n=1 Tax=Muricoccus nepalensis TaxID=1854500 RepID=A0A502G1P2_9PROT|nr:DUF4403 family protein [Roseomonas nepalensis]TPG55482.1 DUF4403 family protein [Roseomonas nepalensis]